MHFHPLIECVPNFSEGRDIGKVQAILKAILDGPDIFCLDQSMDSDHHRSVITFVGTETTVGEAALRAIQKAAELAWVRYGIPTYLYGAAARSLKRQNLEDIRRGGFEILRDEVRTHPERRPDFGEAQLHPTAGATSVGARKFLVAYNINLDTSNVSVARTIARRIRAANGGLRCVKALGLPLASRNLVQVSMNLTDYEVTPLRTVFEAVRREADALGVNVLESEIVGLIPQAALQNTSADELKIRDFTPDKILENRLVRILGNLHTSDE